MDPLVPNFTAYELDYTSDINKKMRIPEKLLYDTDRSCAPSESTDVSFRNYPVADLVMNTGKSPECTPGYSPDLLNNTDVRSRYASATQSQTSVGDLTVSAVAHASAAIIEKPVVADNAQTSFQKFQLRRLNSLDSKLVNIQMRLSHLEFQETLFKTGLTIYIFYNIIRWIMRNRV